MNTTTPSQSSNRADMIAVFRAYLIEAFHVPAEEALARINRELGANPLTRHMRLKLRA